ncbi:tRNA 4-thiouridine(8) synthase ThiI [Methanococcus aeolicus]|nr:tRNA uracil 4-sulfurtransferase ThiI [Methanococcus aeolicus]UXM85560.1 tRNA 4-thiouridine(8) synthase ThiI [Methanococcus aeolicus]
MIKVIVRYGEIGTKARGTRKRFEQTLKENIKNTLKKYNIYSEVDILHTRLLLTINKDNLDKSLELLGKISGIVSYSPILECNLDINEIEKLAIEVFDKEINTETNKTKDIITFAVKTQRVKKKFKMNSMELSAHIGSSIALRYEDSPINLKVDLKNPDILLNIELMDNAMIFTKKIRGIGGIPVGTQGKVLVLLSDGIDSSVASYYIIKRGCNAVFLHMKLSEEGLEKTKKLCGVLNDYDCNSELIVVDYKEELKNIVSNLKKINREKYACVFCKKTMLKIAEKYAKENNCHAIVNGDNLGQVASQTLKNLAVISEGVELPILRPLIGFDKQEIINKAKEIGTYEISISKEIKCFAVPIHPITNADIREIRYIEERLERNAKKEEIKEEVENNE